MILLQAINTTGSISADWVLVGVCSIAAFLGILILNDIRASLRNHTLRITELEKGQAITVERTEYAHERIDDLKKAIT